MAFHFLGLERVFRRDYSTAFHFCWAQRVLLGLINSGIVRPL